MEQLEEKEQKHSKPKLHSSIECENNSTPSRFSKLAVFNLKFVKIIQHLQGSRNLQFWFGVHAGTSFLCKKKHGLWSSFTEENIFSSSIGLQVGVHIVARYSLAVTWSTSHAKSSDVSEGRQMKSKTHSNSMTSKKIRWTTNFGDGFGWRKQSEPLLWIEPLLLHKFDSFLQMRYFRQQGLGVCFKQLPGLDLLFPAAGRALESEPQEMPIQESGKQLARGCKGRQKERQYES